MPQYRKLWVKSLESLDINDMPDDFTRLLWVLLPLGLDREGRGMDSSSWVRSKIFPMREDVSNKMVQKAMDWYADRGMIKRYLVAGRRYFYIPTWSRYQGDTIKEAASNLPDPPQEQLLSNSGVSPEQVGNNLASDSSSESDADIESIKEDDSTISTHPLNRAPPDPYDAMQQILERNLGLPILPKESEIKAIRAMISAGVNECDVQAAIAFFKDKGKVARDADHLLKSVLHNKAMRIQATHSKSNPRGNGSAVKPDDLATVINRHLLEKKSGVNGRP